MKVSYKWLKEYVDIDVDITYLADRLLKVGLEVEEIDYQGKDIKNVFVGRINSISKHENSDHLQICQLDVGEKNGGIVQIVTGAQNVFEGAVVPVALVGAVLPSDFSIKEAKLRGVPSYGMLCSGKELAITDADAEGASVDGILILPSDAPIGKTIQEYLELDDIILDVSITANRPDCQSIYGIAREVAAILNKPIKPIATDYESEKGTDINNALTVEVSAPDLCPRYMAAVVKDMRFVQTPKWMKTRLKSMGIRSINIFVDITNYVLTELGQPMHAFDYDKLRKHTIFVRRGKENEKIVILSEKEIELSPDILAICDGEGAAAIAGIMGGLSSGITENTNTMVFESAKFARDSIRKSSRTIGVRSDSSARFEKGIDVYTTELALKRALNLISQTGAGKILEGTISCSSESVRDLTINTPVKRIDDLLGIKVPHDEIISILNSLQIECSISNGVLTAKIPNFRTDMESYEDIAEEIIRYYGYDHITGTLLKKASLTHGGFSAEQDYINSLKTRLVDLGYSEAISYSFTSPKYIENLDLREEKKHNNPIKIINALGDEISVMRTTLVHSMLNLLSTNTKKSNDSCRLFEIAKVYIRTCEELPNEIETLSIGEYCEGIDFFVTKSALEAAFENSEIKHELIRSDRKFLHPGRSCNIVIDDEVVGYMGEIHPKIAEQYDVTKRAVVMELSLEKIIRKGSRTIKFSPFSRYQTSERDLAVIVDDKVEMRQIMQIIESEGKALLSSAKLFDVYTGEQVEKGKKSLAFNLKFSHSERTLTDAEIEDIMNNIIEKISMNLGGKLR